MAWVIKYQSAVQAFLRKWMNEWMNELGQSSHFYKFSGRGGGDGDGDGDGTDGQTMRPAPSMLACTTEWRTRHYHNHFVYISSLSKHKRWPSRNHYQLYFIDGKIKWQKGTRNGPKITHTYRKPQSWVTMWLRHSHTLPNFMLMSPSLGGRGEQKEPLLSKSHQCPWTYCFSKEDSSSFESNMCSSTILT